MLYILQRKMHLDWLLESTRICFWSQLMMTFIFIILSMGDSETSMRVQIKHTQMLALHLYYYKYMPWFSPLLLMVRLPVSQSSGNFLGFAKKVGNFLRKHFTLYMLKPSEMHPFTFLQVDIPQQKGTSQVENLSHPELLNTACSCQDLEPALLRTCRCINGHALSSRSIILDLAHCRLRLHPDWTMCDSANNFEFFFVHVSPFFYLCF